MWFCRSGQKYEYYKVMIECNELFLPWKGFNINLTTLDNKQDFIQFVKKEKHIDNTRSIANWSGQLNTFCNEMAIGDYVLLPEAPGLYSLVKITGEYNYHINNVYDLHHGRSFILLKKGISRTIFPQHIKYTLQAYRTLFRVKNEEEVLSLIKERSV